MDGKKRSALSKRKKKTKLKSNRKWLKATFVVFVAILFLFFASLLYLNSLSDQPNTTGSRAAILDGLYNTRPNSVFTRNLTSTLKAVGFHVDLFQGESVTIDLLRNIRGYELVILRLHSGIHTDKFLYLFSGEPYTESKYAAEQLSRAVRKAYSFDEEETPVFALNSVFLGSNNPEGLTGSTIILTGCNGTNDSYAIQRFIERGAKAYVSWNGYVDLSYSDSAILMLVRFLYLDGLNLEEAVEKILKDIGPDPFYASTMEYYVSP